MNTDDAFGALKSRQPAELAKWLKQTGANPNLTDKEGRTLLQVAVEASDERAVRLLLEHGARVNRSRKLSELPLGLAFANPNRSSKRGIINALLDAGADPNVPFYVDGDGSPLCSAVSDNDVEMVKRLLEAGASLNGQGNYRGNALCQVDSDEQIGVAKILLDAGADPLTGSSKYGFTPLHTAAGIRGGRCLELYIRQVRPDELDVSFEGGDHGTQAPLHVAVERGLVENAKTLLAAGAHPDGRVDVSREVTPLMRATVKENIELIRLLIEHGADLKARDKSSNTPLQCAIWSSKYSSIKVLLPHEDIRDIGNVLLAYYMTGNAKAKSLRGRYRPYTEKEVVLEDRRDVWQRLGWDKAVPSKTRREILKTVLQARPELLDTADIEGNTVVHHLCTQGALGKDIKLLAEAGGDLTARNGAGTTPLMAYLGCESKGISKAGVDVLLDAGADLNEVDAQGRSAMDILEGNPYASAEVKDHLLKLGAEPATAATATTGVSGDQYRGPAA